MSAFEKWTDFARPIYEAQKLIQRQRHNWLQDKVDIMALRGELSFLYTCVCYTDIWSSDAAQEFKEYVKHDFLKIFNAHPFESKVADVLHVLVSLKEKMAVLKLEIGTAYDGSLSSLLFQPQSTFGWSHFHLSLQLNLRHLSDQNSCLIDPLKQQMKALLSIMNSVEWLITSCYYVSSPWVENMRAHYGGMFVQVAHLCCLCWYNASLDENSLNDVAIALSDLWHKMDPATPEFLEIAFGFLRQCDGKYSEVSVSSFLHYVFDSVDKREILHRELVFLLTYLIKVPETHDDMDVLRILEGIKYVVTEARSGGDKYWGEEKSDLAILFAKIWSLKAEIFIKGSDNVLIFSKESVLEALDEGCKFLEQKFSPTIENPAEDQIVQLIKGVPEQVHSLYQSPPDKKYLMHHKVSNSLFKSLVHVMLLKAKSLLSELMSDASLEPPLKLQIEYLCEGLFFLIHSNISQPKEITGDEKLILIDMEVVASEVISVYRILKAVEGKEAAGENMKVQLSSLLEKVQHIKAKLKKLYLQFPVFVLPKTPGFVFIQLLLGKLRELQSTKPHSIANATHQIKVIIGDLEFGLLTFQDVVGQIIEKLEYNDLHVQLIDMAYQVEHVVDSMLGENKVVWQHILWLYHLSEQIRDIVKQLKEINVCSDGVNNLPQSSEPVLSQVTTTAPVDEITVGFKEQKKEIIDHLTHGNKTMRIVSIVGMPGIGKTTLANNIFCSQEIRLCFQIRAWCHVSQNYKERDLLFDILSNVITVTENTHTMSNESLHELLCKQLKGKKYLIVMDDMWSTEAFKDFRFSFPKDSHESRILLTSRLQLPDEILELKPDLLHLPQLSAEESWELLKAKIFGVEECPEDLLEVGQEIAKNCKGLPLGIVAIAGLLDRTCGRSQDSWKQIGESVSSRVVNDPETQCMKLLELSYNHLPNHLKVCLLYFGAFAEDRDIPVQRLQWLWISEGFLCNLQGKSLEDLAEDYLLDLIGRSLVTVAKKKSNGRVKACRVHDVIRELCLSKAKEDRFLQLISAKDEPYYSFDCLDFGLLYESFHTSDSIKYDQYRLYFHVDREQFVVSRPSGPFVRSLIFSGTSDTSPRCSYDVSFIPENFERLRVLDIESINMGNTFGSGIELLVQLRYLVVCGDMESIPPSLSKLQNLVTLSVKGLKRKVVLPHTIWRMKNLRHVHVSNHAIFTLPIDKEEKSLQLDSMVTLSLPYLLFGKEANEILEKLPNLRKLKCVFSTPKQSLWNFSKVPALKSLCHLETLKILYYGEGKVLKTSELNLPSGLKKLTLSDFYLSRNHISEIRRLEGLEVLKLISCTFEETSWDMTEEEFPELKYLELNNVNVVNWISCRDGLPVLQQLLLRNCEHLKEFPVDFCSIPTLEKIEVHRCSSSVDDSLREILEIGYEKPEIVINQLHSASNDHVDRRYFSTSK